MRWLYLDQLVMAALHEWRMRHLFNNPFDQRGR
jgi:hypothetical protein